MGDDAARQPQEQELEAYGRTLLAELEEFLGIDDGQRNQIRIAHDDEVGMLELALAKKQPSKRPVEIMQFSEPASRRLKEIRNRLMEHRRRWLYFNRNLQIIDGPRTYFFKPMQRVHWTQTQAMMDAGDLIADLVAVRKS